MDSNPPTMADLAYSAADNNEKKIKELEKKVQELILAVRTITNILAKLVAERNKNG